jgi:hypothetical protein
MRTPSCSRRALGLALLVASAGCGGKGTPTRDAAKSDADGSRVDLVPEREASGDVPPGPEPTVLARAPGCGAARLALAGDTLFWTERATGVVKKVRVTGGAPALVASGQALPGAITADDAAVYWSDEGDRTVRRAPHADAGAGAAPLVTADAPVSALLATDGVVYYSAGPSTYVVPRGGGVTSKLATFATCRPNTPGALAAGGDYIYETTDLLQFIVRLRADGQQRGANPCVAADAGAQQIEVPETVSHTQGALLLDALAVTASEVVWADHGFISAKTNGALAQATSRDVALSAGSNVITGFTVAGPRVYLGESDDPGAGPTAHTIQVAPLGTAGAAGEAPAATVVATGQVGARSFVASATHVYWITHTPAATSGAPADCAIVSLAQ